MNKIEERLPFHLQKGLGSQKGTQGHFKPFQISGEERLVKVASAQRTSSFTNYLGLRKTGLEPLTLHSRASESKKARRRTPSQADGKIILQVTQNNSIGSLTSLFRQCLYTTSSGAQGFRGARRGTSAAFFAVGVALAEKARSLGISRVDVHSQGMGKYRISVFRGLLWGGLTLLSLHEETVRPHNGCRPPSIRRL